MQRLRIGIQTLYVFWGKAMLQRFRELGVFFLENVPMSGKTSFQIGGPAELMLFPARLEELSACVRLCHADGERPFILGRGSNLLVNDSGLPGVVIATESVKQHDFFGGVADPLAVNSAKHQGQRAEPFATKTTWSWERP
jgi:hypothetical protein